MKLNNKSLIVTIAVLFSVPSQAQHYGYRNSSYHQTSSQYGARNTPYIYYGFRLGINGSTVHSDDSRLDGGNTQSGVNIGATMDIMLTPTTPLFFETGLEYTEKGGKGSNHGKNFTYGLNYLEVPLLLKYQYKVDRDIAITPFVGGYLAYGTGGKIKNLDDRVSTSAFSSENFQRFDGGLRVGCGTMLGLFYVEVGYDAGLTNISNDTFDSSHTGSLFANIGINF